MSVKLKKLSIEAKEMNAIKSLGKFTEGIRKSEGENFKSIDDVVAKKKIPDVWRKKKGKKSKAKRKTKDCGCK
jgi:hypothetical protein